MSRLNALKAPPGSVARSVLVVQLDRVSTQPIGARAFGVLMSVLETKAPKSAAPGPYLGFSLQQVRLCYHLFDVADGGTVSLEHEDDVTVRRPDGSVVLEQCKSALASNPVADRADALWNTFANWADHCAEDLKLKEAQFVLYVAPEKSGAIVQSLHSACGKAPSAAALEQVKALVNAEKPEVGCGPNITRFLAVGDDTCAGIIDRFRFVAEADPLEAVRKQLRPALSADMLDVFVQAAIGFARERADELIRLKKPAVIDASAFRKFFSAFARKHDLSGLLLSPAPAPTEAAVAALVGERPIFVQQLQAVECSDDLLVTAVSDFLRTVTDKVDWADEGRIVAESLQELDGELIRHHKLARDEVDDTMSASTDVQRGRALYRRCSNAKLPLEGRALPAHFIPGSFNGLADDRQLGWHPDHLKLFPLD